MDNNQQFRPHAFDLLLHHFSRNDFATGKIPRTTPIFIPFGESPGNNNWDRGKSDGRADVIQAEARARKGGKFVKLFIYFWTITFAKNRWEAEIRHLNRFPPGFFRENTQINEIKKKEEGGED